jgi:hypothetical protein
MKHFWNVGARNSPQRAFFVFHTYDPSPGGLGVQLRPEYQRLVCPACTWWDPRKAAKRGIHRDVRCPFRDRDILVSDDSRLVVSKKFRKVAERIPGADLDYFALPGDKQFFVAFARKRILPPDDTPIPKASVDSWKLDQAFVPEGRCRKCGHFLGVAYNEESLRLTRPVTLAAAILDRGKWYGFMEAFIASDEVADKLRKASLRGLWLRKIVPIEPKPKRLKRTK